MKPFQGNRCRGSAALFGFVILALLGSSCANPEFFVKADDPAVKQSFPDSPTTPAGCTEHPKQKYGVHSGVKGDETGTTFNISTPSQLSSGTNICKGLGYTLKVAFGGGTHRFALLTAVGGVLGKSDAYTNIFGASGDPCAGQRLVVQPGIVQNADFTTTLTVPCNSSAPAVMLSLTSAESSIGAFLQISKNFTVADCETPCVDAPTAATNPTPSSSSRTSRVGKGEQEEEEENEGQGSSPPAPGSVIGTISGGGTAGGASQGTVGRTVGGSGMKCVAATSGCTPSNSGYSCLSKGAAGVTIHYSLGTCVPDNECTRGAAWTAGSGPPTQQLLHMMAEADTSGYVSVGFTPNPGRMANTDAIIGAISSSGQGSLDVYPLSRESLPAPYTNSTSMLSYSSVIKTSDGRTIVCFARPLNSPDYKYSATLDPANLELNEAIGRSTNLVLHKSAGGHTINIATGISESSGEGEGEKFIYAHGALMVIAWVGLAPLGALLARHRWSLGEKKIGGIHLWFQLHRAIQTAAVVTAIVAFIIALTELEAGETKVGEAHKIGGFIVMGMAVLQIIAAIPRPKPDSEHRMKWNLLHWWLGRGTLVLAVTVCILGVVLLHESDAQPYARWLVPICVWLGLLLVVDVGLSVSKGKADKRVPPMPDSPQHRRTHSQPTYSPTYGAV